MTDLRRPEQVEFEEDVLVECRVIDGLGRHVGMVVDASFVGLRLEFAHVIDVHAGDRVSVRFARDELNEGLGIAGNTAVGEVIRVKASPRGTMMALEVPDLRGRVRADLSRFLARYPDRAA